MSVDTAYNASSTRQAWSSYRVLAAASEAEPCVQQPWWGFLRHKFVAGGLAAALTVTGLSALSVASADAAPKNAKQISCNKLGEDVDWATLQKSILSVAVPGGALCALIWLQDGVRKGQPILYVNQVGYKFTTDGYFLPLVDQSICNYWADLEIYPGRKGGSSGRPRAPRSVPDSATSSTSTHAPGATFLVRVQARPIPAWTCPST